MDNRLESVNILLFFSLRGGLCMKMQIARCEVYEKQYKGTPPCTPRLFVLKPFRKSKNATFRDSVNVHISNR